MLRRFPVSGTYTADQRAIYQLVLNAQKAAERNSKPGMSIRAAGDSAVMRRSSSPAPPPPR
jgi:Xaa-Pro aminopeptidase